MRLSVLVMPVVVAAAAMTTALAAPAGAYPPEPACGTTLTVDTSLRRDLACPGDGLTLAPGVTLNLRGHTLSGSRTGTGLSVSAFGPVVVRNGTVAGWGTGIATLLEGEWEGVGSPLTVERVTFRDNHRGLDTTGLDGTGEYVKPTTVVRSTFDRNDEGLVAGWQTGAKVDRSTFVGNGVGAWSAGFSSVDIDRSRFEGNATALRVYEAWATVARSTFVDNTLGVTHTNLGAVTIADSRFAGGDVAVTASWDSDVAVSGSTFTGSGTGVLMDVGIGTFERNTFTSNGIGFHLTVAGAGVVLRDNVFRANGDGILSDVDAPGLQLGGNTARRNTGWGIYAPGAVDLGGNTARGNGRSPQCVGVVCATQAS
ncbi:hypothetical protein Cch01nite_34810 [Cellulomonas chitinilytica]|uniref:Right handed beta helix domain-containing protein n=1 Tax=Cellulomonas chitinilytica TaxID=398759 RepID=A0A919P5Z8_9CELL|nr:right-handed parallel beta-helix repeat-containing protein [Cellulomonas chitinilytica]GIG22757.1 hypothetical protein Cch01nite_34810 [Cellulomonas chitinilytica]